MFSALVCLGNECAGDESYRESRVRFGTSGYDGQYYYALSQRLWKRHREDEVICRITAMCGSCIRPWVGVDGRNACARLWVLPLISLALLGGTAGVGTVMAAVHGRATLIGLLAEAVVLTCEQYLAIVLTLSLAARAQRWDVVSHS
jgi:hypothetical protein